MIGARSVSEGNISLAYAAGSEIGAPGFNRCERKDPRPCSWIAIVNC